MENEPSLVEQIRAYSRSMVRDWGFMGESIAGADLSPSAVHALLEIEEGNVSAKELGSRLRLEKSSVSRMLRKLVQAGDIRESPDVHDSRLKQLSLTPAGRLRVESIHAHARAQVTQALERLNPGQKHTVSKGLQLYSAALASRAQGARGKPVVDLATGYQPGLIARITQMHAQYYSREAGLGQGFESVVAAGLAEFSNRLKAPRNRIWAAMHEGEIAGSVAIDGEDLEPGIAHLRWFIADDSVRGSGAGRQLLGAALEFADRQGFRETQLWTFSGLAAARHLYESHGFKCVEERFGDQWGKPLLEQRFSRPSFGGRDALADPRTVGSCGL